MRLFLTHYQEEAKGFRVCNNKGIKSSSETVVFNLHEAIYSTSEQGDTAHIAFLDAHKAFDTVWHKHRISSTPEIDSR